MRFDERFIDELKSRLRLSDIIGKTVKLRRQGREFVGLSPFTKERTPSFFVNDDKGFFHDFSSGKSGDLIAFLQETERLSFVEAVERLAAEAGMALPVPSQETALRERERQTLSDWLELAAKWFEAELRRPVGTEARAYLDRRGLPEADWARFRIGFASPRRTGLRDYLVERGATPGELVEAGLLVAPEDGGAPYDRFRTRIMFPIADARGRIVSFGGRALDPDARAKYLNGPETRIFHKGSVLYGLGEARKLLTAETAIVVVEGYTDAIACQRAGIPAVASMGTALTDEQMDTLWRFSAEPILCFDSDAAGQRAASRSIDNALPGIKPGRSFRFATTRSAKDPDEVLRLGGPEVLRTELSRTRTFVDALFQREYERETVETPEGKASLKGRLRRAALSIGYKDLAEEYLRALLDKYYAQFRTPRFSDERFDYSSRVGALLFKTRLPNIQERIRTFNSAVAVAAVYHPQWIRDHVETFQKFGFGDKRLSPLVQPLIDALQNDAVTEELVRQCIKADGAALTLERAEYFAFEVKKFTFLDQSLEPRKARPIWLRCFEAMLELSAIEIELEERRTAFETRQPVVDGADPVSRGRLLRKHGFDLLNKIHSGALWKDGAS